MDVQFRQKRINHIFHYTKSFESLIQIINQGFAPSYCQEQITDLTYLIPMVSFCNISIQDVDLYMRYGNYGLGMSVDWAIRNQISPVIYVHDNSPFARLHRSINEILLFDMLNTQVADFQRQIYDAVDSGKEYTYQPPQDDRYTRLLSDINNITVPALQFFKNWKVKYDGQDIITYHEREWRYIPELIGFKKIILSEEEEFATYIDKESSPKPHLPQFALQIDSIEDIRYLIINSEEERSSLINSLNAKFGEPAVLSALFNGTFLILNYEQIKNDF